MSSSEPVIEVRRLAVGFPDRAPIASDLSLDLAPGRIHGLVGESGSGKSLLCLSILGLQPAGMVVTGTVRHDGVDLVGRPPAELRRFRSSVARLVFQDPWSSMNPSLTIGRQIVESIRSATSVSRKEARERAADVLRRVGITDPEARLRAYPRELSGGLLQRCAIAMALAARPRVLLCDEPTTALDATTELRVLDLLVEVARDLDVAVLLTTHDLILAERYCDDLSVMYRGSLVEAGPPQRCLSAPYHPYTEALAAAVPRPGRTERRTPLKVLDAGSGPEAPGGCSFTARCPHAEDRCREAAPPLDDVLGHPGHRAACWIEPRHRVAVGSPS
jgi:oligopeptide/dipeptide ABC transporter ATP-binding protein